MPHYTYDNQNTLPDERSTEAREAPLLTTRLDKWTNCDQGAPEIERPAYRVVARDYGDGEMEATVTIARPYRKPKGTHREAPQSPEPQRLLDNMNRAVGRARTTIRRSIMAASLDHLLTLTYRSNVQDAKRVWKDFGRFIRLIRKNFSNTYPYVAVQEAQKRGAIHIHAAVAGFQNVKFLRSAWLEVIGGRDSGNIDVQYFSGARSKLAKYLAKYLSKDLAVDTAKGVHRYKRSRGILVPQKIIYFNHSAAIDCELIDLFENQGAKVSFHKNNFSAEGPKWLWACSWL